MTDVFEAAIAAYREKRWEDAVRLASDALRLEPNNLDALEVFGLAWFRRGYTANAIEALEFCHSRAPTHARYASNLGELYRAAGELDKCVAMLAKAAKLDPESISLLESSGLTFLELGDLRRAETALSQVADLDDAKPLPHFNLGEVRRLAGRYDDALTSYDEALARDPNLLQAQHQKALCLLGKGDYPQGWALFEHRLSPRLSRQVDAPEPRWQGAFEPGQRVFVYSDQGIGDAILFSRYLPHLAGQGVNLLVAAPQPLLPLLRACMPTVEFVALDAPRDRCDWQIALGSLPGLYQTQVGNVPNLLPYLTARPEKIAAWQTRLVSPQGGMRVGVCWAGNARAAGVRHRSCTVEQIIGLFEGLPGVTVVNLQFERPDEVRSLCERLGAMDVTAEIQDFEDTAAVLANLDLVISVDTALLNLAGALNVPAWGLLTLAPEWRWLGPDRRSRWYPNVLRFSQAVFGEWAAPLAVMRDTLRSHVNAAVIPASGNTH